MKIEIDLNDILGDEDGAETLQESVRRQVIDGLTTAVKKGVGEQINHAVAKTIQTQIEEYVEKEMPAMLAGIVDSTYIPVNRWGEREREPTTFRKELVKSINENMVYKKTNYSSDANAFTKAVDGVIEENLKSFKAEFQKKVDADFVAHAFQYAQDALKKKLGITG